MYQIILYYNFQRIEDPEQFCREHKRKCRELNLLGRVYVAREGINGTLAGAVEDIEAYKKYLWSLPGFQDTEFKEDDLDQIPFVKLMVKTRPEIVALKASVKVDPTQERGPYLTPHEWRKTLESGEDFTLLDVRNRYESRIGYFEGAVLPEAENFFDFEQWLDQANLNRGKKVLMYCTGGIRCEKFSLLMKKKGFREIYQLHGGIINYAKQEGGAHYKGKCFVFDDRLMIPIEKNQKAPLTNCEITGEPCDTYLNCANRDCNRLFICSEAGAEKYESCCRPECQTAANRRPFDPENIYEPTRKKHTYEVFA